MSLQLALIGLALAAAQPAPSAEPVTLNAGEEINLRVDGDGPGIVTLDRGPAGSLSDFDNAAIRQMSSPAGKEAMGDTALPISAADLGTTAPPAPAPGQVRMTFVPIVNGERTLLIVENGYDRAFVYRARIRVRGQLRASDVCVVMPGRRGYEHWPFPVEAIELSALRLQPWDPSQALSCQ